MDNVSEKIDRWLSEHPQYAFLIFIRGIPLRTFGHYTQLEMGLGTRTSVGWELVDTLGERTYRFWKGVFMAILIIILVVIYCTTY